jgi:hypothetical protein
MAGMTCMNCGAAIASGFFCPKCEAMATAGHEEPGAKKAAPGAYFSGKAGTAKKRDLLAENLVRWTKTVVILAVVGVGGYFVWSNYGDDIMAKVQNAGQEKERYDPTKDSAVVEEGEEGGSKRAFSGADTSGL